MEEKQRIEGENNIRRKQKSGSERRERERGEKDSITGSSHSLLLIY